MYTYFIAPNDVKELTNISDNLSEKYILTAIREAQQTELTTVLGIHFITKLEEAVNKGEVPERYTELLDNYILYFLCYNVISKLIPIASVKIDNAGAVTTGDEKVENLSLDEVFRLQDYYTQKSDYYKMRLQRYLRANRAKYPELDCTSEIHSAYSSPIFLGGKRGKHVIRPCHGCAGHISPEKPDTPDTPEKPYYEVLYTVDGYVHDFDSYQEGERIIPADAPEKDGYTFQYWEGLPEYMPANDITVTAVYQEIPSVQGYYTLRYRVADWREDGEITFDNMAYIPEPFEWLQCVEREYNPETREGWAKLTHPNLTADSEIRLQRFPGHDALFMLDLSDFNNTYMTDRMFADNTTLREFYPPKGLVGMEGYDFFNCPYLSTINFATADGYKEYQPYSYPMTGAFCNCVSLTAILADNQYNMYSQDGNLYNNSHELMAARYGEVTIKEGCTAIKSEALKARGLTALTIPASVRKIEAYAISENMELTDVYFGGTMDEWANIEKDDVNTIFVDTQVQVIHCTDGDCSIDYTGGGSEEPEEPAEHKIDIFIEWDYLETRWFKTGQLIELPEPPVREGYTFQSWNAIVPGGDWFDMPEYMPDYNFEVHASYSANTYKLTYKVDGEVVSETDVEYGTGIIAMEEPVKEGYTFSGWSEIPETMPAHDVEVTGSFSEVKQAYTLTYWNGNEGFKGDEVLKQISVVEGEAIDYFQPPLKEGFTHRHWAYHKDEGVIGNAETEMQNMPAHDLDVWTFYEFNSYNVHYTLYDENGDVYLEDYVTYRYTDTINPYHPDIPEGYTFSWDNEPTVMPAHDVHVTGRLVKPDKPDNPSDYSSQYTTFEALEDGTFSFTKSGNGDDIQYSKDNGATWTPLASGETVSVVEGDKVLWKSTIEPNEKYALKVGQFASTNRFNAYGNTMSLLFGDEFKGKTDLTGKAYAFRSLFKKTKVVDASNLILPATTLAKYCYDDMFSNCESLTTAPSTLPAATLAENCYSYMFSWCTSMTTAPSTLPATVLANACYSYMFSNCKALTTAPELPAATLADSCYSYMFQNCKLTTAPELPATTLTYYCYNYMFYGCKAIKVITILATDISAEKCLNNWLSNAASSGTFKCVSGVNYPQGSSGIPTGWTVEYV